MIRVGLMVGKVDQGHIISRYLSFLIQSNCTDPRHTSAIFVICAALVLSQDFTSDITLGWISIIRFIPDTKRAGMGHVGHIDPKGHNRDGCRTLLQ
jgi:hypothetical protein